MKNIFTIQFTFLTTMSLALVVGCMTPRAHFAPSQLAQTYTPRTAPDKIELFRSQTPTKKFIEIGAVTACCRRDTTLMVDILREKASEKGGDALLALEVDPTGGVSASVIRYQ